LRERWSELEMASLSLSLSLYGRSVRGTWSSFNGDPEGYVTEGSGNRHLSP